MNSTKKVFINLNVLMTVELSSLKFRKTSCCKPVILLKRLYENKTIDNRIIPPYVTGKLKHSMHMT